MKVAVFGLGRSGLYVAEAVKKLGGSVTVFDQKQRDAITKPELITLADEQGIDTQFGWDGILDPTGFDFLVVNPAVDHRSPVLKQIAASGLEIISEVEFAYRISKAPIIAITGTNGKSTTAVMVYECLRHLGLNPILCGNIFGSGYAEQTLTQAATHATQDQVLVAEVSSFQLEWVSQFRPAVSVITNITPDHLDRYDTFQDYANTKMRIWSAQTQDDYVIVRGHDPVVVPPGKAGIAYRSRRDRGNQNVQVGRPGPTVYTFGASGDQARVEDDQTRVLDKVIPHSRWPFLGTHNYANASAAMLASYAYLKWRSHREPDSVSANLIRNAENQLKAQIEKRRSVFESPRNASETLLALPEELAHSLDQFRGLDHRMETVGEKDGVVVINNSMCTNPAAVVASVQAVRGEVHILLGGVNKELDFLPLKSFLESHRHQVYIFGRDREEIAGMLGGKGRTFSSMEEAFRSATEQAKPGSFIMLAPGCASTDQFRDFRHRGDVFRSIAKEWLL